MKISRAALCSFTAVVAVALASGASSAQAVDPPGYVAHKAAALTLAAPGP